MHRQLVGPGGMRMDCVSVPICGEGGEVHKPRQNLSERKVKEIDLLSWIGDLTADSPQSLEAVPDGVDVCHSHEHDLTVGVVL